MQSARSECSGSYQEGRGISLDALAPQEKLPQGYGVYLESLLQPVPEEEEDGRSEKSGSTATDVQSTAASSTEPASVYEGARGAAGPPRAGHHPGDPQPPGARVLGSPGPRG